MSAKNALAAERSQRPWLIVGDLNTTKHGIDEVGKSVPGGQHLDRLEGLGWIEAWRSLNPDAREYTWYHPTGSGFRIDHAYLSPPLAPKLRACRLLHDLRERKFSDHSAIEVMLDI